MRARLLAASAALLLTAGCGGEPSPEPAPYKRPAAKSEPSAPVMPSAAKSADSEGAAAFVEYYFTVFAYASNSGDTTELGRLGRPACSSCSQVVDAIDETYKAGGSSTGVAYEVTIREVAKNSGFRDVTASVRSEKQRVVASSGAEPKTEPPFDLEVEFRLEQVDDRWVVTQWTRQ